jgi:hypothetical protein
MGTIKILTLLVGEINLNVEWKKITALMLRSHLLMSDLEE